MKYKITGYYPMLDGTYKRTRLTFENGILYKVQPEMRVRNLSQGEHPEVRNKKFEFMPCEWDSPKIIDEKGNEMTITHQIKVSPGPDEIYSLKLNWFQREFFLLFIGLHPIQRSDNTFTLLFSLFALILSALSLVVSIITLIIKLNHS